MKNFLKHIFKQYPSVIDSYEGDSITMILSITGALEIAIFFIVLGLVGIFALKRTMPKEAYKERSRITLLFCLAVFFCGVSRMFDVVAVWHNYALLNAIFRNITGILSLLTIGYLPFVVKAVNNIRTLQDVKESLTKTNEKVERLTTISEKLIEVNKNG